MIEQLIHCAQAHSDVPTNTLIAQNGTGYYHFRLFKDLAQLEKTKDSDIDYNKIRKEGIKTRHLIITFIYNSYRIVVLRFIDSYKFMTCALAKFPERFNLPWKKGDITSAPMSEYNIMDDVILYYGWLRISMTATIDRNGIDPMASFSTMGFSLKA